MEHADALNAGVDLNCGNTYAALSNSLRQNLTDEAKVNRALHRLLLARIRLGMMDPRACSPYGVIGEKDSTRPRTINWRCARQRSRLYC
jgi:beta-glucosidase